MTALEIFEKRIKIGTLSRDYGHTVDDKLFIDNANELDTIEQALIELETLKKDVARYFETRNRLKTILPNANDITEFWALEEKLLKVGKEE